MSRKFNFLLTGASGFIGSHLVEEVIRQNEFEKIVCLVRSSSDTSLLEKLPVEIARVDFDKPETIRPYMQQADYFFHLAAMNASPKEELLFKANRDLPKTLLSLYLEFKQQVKGFFFLSSLAAVGPKDYGYDDPRRKEHLNPLTGYGRSKLAGERLYWDHLDQPDTNIAILRAPSVFGKRDKDVRQFFDLVRKGLAPVVGDGNNKVTLINARDLVKFAYKITLDDSKKGIFYIYSNEVYTWNDIERISRVLLNKWALKVKIPPFLVYFCAAINERVGKNYIFNREKYLEMVAKDWAYEQNDFEKANEKIEYDLEKGIAELYPQANK